jgi:hypothetical protein
MAINKAMTLTDPLGHEMPVNYHVILNINNDMLNEKSTVYIGSYHSKEQYELNHHSFVKPPMHYTFDGGDMNIAAAQDTIIDLPNWVDSTIVD